jgi:hypothetical protein
MPDFERCLRSLELDCAKDDIERRVIESFYKGQDSARKEALFIFTFIAFLIVVFKFLITC